MTEDGAVPPAGFGGWRDADALRRWSFARRTPQQRLEWLVDALTVAYEAAGARAGILDRNRFASSVTDTKEPRGNTEGRSGSSATHLAEPRESNERDVSCDPSIPSALERPAFE